MIIFVLIFWYLAYESGLVEMSSKSVDDGGVIKVFQIGIGYGN